MTAAQDSSYPSYYVAVDCVIIRRDGPSDRLLLIQRRSEPFAGQWALPGGFMEPQETARQAAGRELAEETGLAAESLEQLHAFTAVDRDPRGRVISIAYLALIDQPPPPVRADSDARAVEWFALDQLPPLAFDHREIIGRAVQRLQSADHR